MEDQPCTSKESTKRNAEDEDKYEESRNDQATNSETTLSNYSAKSRLHMASTGAKKPKPSTPETKRRKRRLGRIEKQRRPATRRQVIRRAPKKRKRELSVSTMYSNLSSGLVTPACERCGHRCCLRRYIFELRRKRYVRDKRRYTKRMPNIYKTESIQAGSCSKMLSPLCVNTNSTPISEQPCTTYSKITPEMIYESLRHLTMWKQNVDTNSILDYVQRNYPVNQNSDLLLKELLEKLRIAVIVDIVKQTSNDTWCLNCALEKRKLNKTHVTMFWKLYGDTLRPIKKKPGEVTPTARLTNQEQELLKFVYEIL